MFQKQLLQNGTELLKFINDRTIIIKPADSSFYWTLQDYDYATFWWYMHIPKTWLEYRHHSTQKFEKTFTQIQ